MPHNHKTSSGALPDPTPKAQEQEVLVESWRDRALKFEERAKRAVTYCGECGQPGECPCLGNWRERAERAEARIAELETVLCGLLSKQ
jgi:hypothetical protein